MAKNGEATREKLPRARTPAQYIRRKVSLQKRRYIKDGYDLDLAYVTRQLIAMGFPSQGRESFFRNPMSDVKKFLRERHDGHYKVFNLCIEREYDVANFGNQVSRFGYFDHQAPPIGLISEFCNEVQKFLAEDKLNVAAIHCKAGKGRAGMMTCCYLLHSGLKKTPKDAMDYFALKRTMDGKGVTIPSQITYIGYYADILAYGLVPAPASRTKKSGKGKGSKDKAADEAASADPATTLLPIRLKSISVRVSQYAPEHKLKSGKKAELRLQIEQNQFSSDSPGVPDLPVLLALKDCKPVVVEDVDKVGSGKKKGKGNKGGESGYVSIPIDMDISGDIKVTLFDTFIGKGKKEMGHFYFNTFFVEDNELLLPKSRLDKIWADKKNKLYTPEFSVKLDFEGAAPGGNQLRKQRGDRIDGRTNPSVDATTLPPCSVEELAELDVEITRLKQLVEDEHEDIQMLEDKLVELDEEFLALKRQETKRGGSQSASNGKKKDRQSTNGESAANGNGNAKSAKSPPAKKPSSRTTDSNAAKSEAAFFVPEAALESADLDGAA